jgi:HEAT repeat protein
MRAMRRTALALALATLAACPRATPKPTPTPTELSREDRLAFAQLEAQRDAAVPKLIELADDRMAPKRALALRALGRIGSPDAIRALRARLIGQEGVLAAAALGMAAATGMIEPADATAIVGELTPLSTGPGRLAVLEAIARLGTPAARKPLSAALGAREVNVVVAAALGLGRLGRG